MGSCISKCKPQHTKNVVQDKLVISQAPSPPPIILLPPKYKISPSPPSPTSSFTCTAATTTTTVSSSSSSSLSSASSFTSKDRSFSNEFLLSCYKDNPQISRINSLTRHHAITSPSFSNNQKPHNKVLPASSTHKRLRSNSPTYLTRQKSFRKDSSPSPRSTRFINTNNGGDYYKYSGNSSSMDTSTVSKRMNGNNNNIPKVSSVQSCSRCCASSNSLRNNNKAGASPNNNLGRLQCSSGLRHRAMTRTLRVGSKIDENVVKQVVSSSNNSNNNDMDLDLIEDIDNPLISLDCFIFL